MDTRHPLAVLYDADCGICTHTARVLARLDSRGQLNLVALQQATLPGQPPRHVLSGALHAVDAQGRWTVGAAAVVEICRRVPLLRPISAAARFPVAMRALDLLYTSVANNRHSISRLLGLKACRVRNRVA